MLTVARLMIAAASAREESRGVHTRPDFPATDPAWAQHIALDPGSPGGRAAGADLTDHSPRYGWPRR